MENNRRWRRILRGGGSRARNGWRLREEDPPQPCLDDLPHELLQSIMLHVSQNLEHYFQARNASNTLTRITDDEVFLRAIDLFNMHVGNLAHQTVWNFRLLCHHRGNISALFMQGCSEFFHRHELENGFAIIRECAIRGYELAIYTYSNLRRVMSPNLEVDLDITNPDRGLMRRMRSRVEALTFRYFGPNRLPELFIERREALDADLIYRCRCATSIAWIRPWFENCKDPSMCDMCFYTIHALAFVRDFPERVRVWPMNYEW